MRLRRLPFVRGASMVEYGLLVVAVMLAAAVSYRFLGKAVRMSADRSVAELRAR